MHIVKYVFLILSFLFVSCTKDELLKDSLYTFKGETITQHVNRQGELSMFAKVLTISKNSPKSNSSTVASLLGSRGNFTAFIPNNAAMTYYLDSLYGKNNYDIDSIQQDVADKIVLNCVVDFGASQALSETQLGEGTLEEPTLNDCNLLIRYGKYGEGVFTKVNNAHIVKHNIELSNGFVEIVDRVIEPSPQTVTGLIQGTKELVIFSKLLDLTSWGDSMLAFKDKNYIQMEEDVLTNTPKNRFYAYMAFVETDDVFHEKWGVPLPQFSTVDGHIENWDAIMSVITRKCQQVYPNAKDTDMKSEDNAVNTFVAYHLVDGKYSLDNLPRYAKGSVDWQTKNMENYYCTKGKKRRLLKVTRVVNDKSIMLNRHSYYNNSFDGDYKETSCDIPGIKVHGDHDIYGYNYARNGYYYTLDDILLYSDEVRDVVLNNRIRYGALGYLPELSSLLLKTSVAEGQKLPSDYCQNLSTNQEYTYEGYMSTKSIEGCYLVMGDVELDFTIKLMPVPFAGKWQVRTSFYEMLPVDAVYKVYFGEKSNLKDTDVVGMPSRTFEYNSDLTSKLYVNDYTLGLDSVACFENDRQLRKHGIMKGPKMYHYHTSNQGNMVDAGGKRVNIDLLTMRDHPSRCRKIVYEGYMEPNKVYYLRMQSRVWQPYKDAYTPFSRSQLDYIELVPESVYNNPEHAEDIW